MYNAEGKKVNTKVRNADHVEAQTGDIASVYISKTVHN
jgi:hypothetical protein